MLKSIVSLETGWWLLVGALVLAGAALGAVTSLAVNIVAIILFFGVMGRPDARRQALAQPMLVLFALCLLALAICFVLTARAPGDMVFVANFLPLLLAAPVFVVARRIADRGQAKTVAGLLLAGTVATLGVCVVSALASPSAHASGLYSAPSIVARLAMVLGFGASAAFFSVRDRWRYLFLLGPVLAFIAVILTQTRGAVIAFPLLVLLFALFVVIDPRQRHPWRLVAIMLTTTIVLATMALLTLGSEHLASLIETTKSLLIGSGDVDTSTQWRLQFYAAGWTLFWQSPWIGYGWANIAIVAFTILDEADYGGAFSPRFFHFHNDIVNFGVGAGGVGIAVYFVLLAAPLVGVLASPRDSWFTARAYALSAIALLYLVTGLTDITFGWDLPTTSYAIICATILGAFRPAASVADEPGRGAAQPLESSPRHAT